MYRGLSMEQERYIIEKFRLDVDIDDPLIFNSIRSKMSELGYDLRLISMDNGYDWCLIKDNTIIFSDDRVINIPIDNISRNILRFDNTMVIENYNILYLVDFNTLEIIATIPVPLNIYGQFTRNNIIYGNTVYDLKGNLIKSFNDNISVIGNIDGTIIINNDNGIAYIANSICEKISEDFDLITTECIDEIGNNPLSVPTGYYRDFKEVDTEEPLKLKYTPHPFRMVPEVLTDILETFSDPESLRLFDTMYEACTFMRDINNNKISAYYKANKILGNEVEISIGMSKYTLNDNTTPEELLNFVNSAYEKPHIMSNIPNIEILIMCMGIRLYENKGIHTLNKLIACLHITGGDISIYNQGDIKTVFQIPNVRVFDIPVKRHELG